MATSFQNCSVRWFPRLVFALLCMMILGCAVDLPLPKHPIMGSDFGYPNYKLTLQTETERANFHVKLFTLKYDDCASGYIDYLEFDGSINTEAIEAFQAIFLEAQGCKARDGRALYPFVYLNSSFGEYKDGYALGELFRRFNIQTIVAQGQVCRGACAVAFLGGKLRKIQDRGTVVFGFSKAKGVGMGGGAGTATGIGIDCGRASEQVLMRAYLQKFLELAAADRLYFNLLNYCTQADGLSLTAETAAAWQVTND